MKVLFEIVGDQMSWEERKAKRYVDRPCWSRVRDEIVSAIENADADYGRVELLRDGVAGVEEDWPPEAC